MNTKTKFILKEKLNILVSFSFFLFFFFILSVSADIPADGNNVIEFKYDKIKFNNNTGAVNSSDFWDNLDTPADITYDEISAGDVNALGFTGTFNFLAGVVGQLSIDGDPWFLSGTDLELNQNLTVNNSLYVGGNVNGIGNDSWFNQTLLIDADDVGNATLIINSDLNKYSCIDLVEGNGNLGFRICNDGAGTNRLVFSNADNGFEWFWIDRDDGTINFLNDTIFTTVNVTTINVGGNVSAEFINGNLTADGIKVDHIAEKTGGHNIVFDNDVEIDEIHTKRIFEHNADGFLLGKDNTENIHISPLNNAIIPKPLGQWDLGYFDGFDTHSFRNLFLSGDANVGGDVKLNSVGANVITATNANGDLRLGAGGGTNDLQIDINGNVEIFENLDVGGDLIVSNITAYNGTFENDVAIGGNVNIAANKKLTFLGSGTQDISNGTFTYLLKDNQFAPDAFTMSTSIGTNDYMRISTANGAEAFIFGNTVENPAFTFSGTGLVTYGGNMIGDGNITSENVFIKQYVFSHTSDNLPVLGASVWTNLTLSEEETAIKFGISHTFNDDTNDTFTFNEEGVYEFTYDYDMIDFSIGSSDIDVAGRVIFGNGTEILGSVFETDIIKKAIEGEVTHNFLVRVKSGDSVVFQFIATDSDVQISTHGTFGDHPDSATIIIKKIANL